MSSLPNYYSSLLKLCCESNNRIQVKKLHCVILKSLKQIDTFVFNNLVSAYAKFRQLAYARRTFDQIPQPNLFSWNAILSAYSKAGQLLDMQQIFSRMPDRDGVTWNAIISGHANYGSPFDAVKIYKLMVQEYDLGPNRITFSTLLILCSSYGMVNFGRQIHGQIIKFGFNYYVFVSSPLVDMYSKASLVEYAKLVFEEIHDRNLVMYNTMMTGLFRCNKIEDAKLLFREMPERDSISWTIMVTGFTQNGLNKEALTVFREMCLEGSPLDQYTFGSALTACGSLSALEQGKQIHAYVIRSDYMSNLFVGSALVDMYSKCRNISSAEKVFKRMKNKNVVSWTALLVGYGQNGFCEEAVSIFSQMQRNGVSPDDFTLGSVISSCAHLAIVEEGAQFHCRAIVTGLISFITVSNAIVTLYGKCGGIEDSIKLFNEMEIKDEVSWTALVSGYAQFGKAKETIELFERMLREGLRPDGVTFIGVISACSRAGLVEKGCQYFQSMVEDHGISPLDDHYTCMIDLFSRAGKLKEAEDFIKQMPCQPDVIGWATLLSSCRLHGNMEIGKWAAESLLVLDPQNPVSYILLSSIYASKKKWEDVANLRRRMRDLRVRKEPGCSWIKYKNKVHIFSADDKSNPYSDQIYAELEKLNHKMFKAGFVPDTSSVLHDVEERDKIRMLSHHSEKLAIAFGLIFVPSEVPIKVVKNLRVCGDCHNATKYISKITGREILVRDAARFHRFRDGVCSCGDFW
ncbi:putative pentatricopeptide repeat-containing protein At1g68930 [Aristolochia californica]|uniref:putative pentatricopeptide repeat-containing protein At1g68930 n=1 Tax=Aristolochia californica TaxID=171875 RepID=UPI0035D592A2